MLTLEEAKLYLRVESNVTVEDDLISALISAAADYIANATGKPDNDSELYKLCEKILVAHWYENRSVATTANIIEIPHSVKAMMTHIKLASAYAESESDNNGGA